MLKVYATGSYLDEYMDTLPNLRPLLAEAAGNPIRRIDRFIQLAVIGACRCVGNYALPENTAVVLGSEHGDLEVTIDVMQSMYLKRQAPKPLAFINTVSNAACFYIARQLQLAGSSNFVGRKNNSFGAALQVAAAELNHGAASMALVGMVDAAVEPLTEYRERLQLTTKQPVQEYSHWLLIGNESTPHSDAALATISDPELFADKQALSKWLQQLKPDELACAGTAEAVTTELLRAAAAQSWSARNPQTYSMDLAAVLTATISNAKPSQLAFIQQTTNGQFYAVAITRS